MRRLSMMSGSEILWRVRTRTWLERLRRQGRAPVPASVAGPDNACYCLPDLGAAEQYSGVVSAAERLLGGQLTALGQTFDVGDGTRWHLDPQSGVVAPLRFGPLMDYRNPESVGNVRNIWELNRHQHLVCASLGFALTRDARFAHFVHRQLESWLEQNPFPLGVNWASPLEFGLRLISWVWIDRLLEGSSQRELLFGKSGCMWDSIYQHQWMLAHLRSRGSSANNHLLGEMAGLLVSALQWPAFPESQSWIELAQAALGSEATRQFFPSGIDREQAYGYHLFATELLVLAGVEAERSGRPFAASYRAAISRAIQAAVAQTGPVGILPTYGDSDDGAAAGLPGGHGQSLDRLTAIGSRWLGLAPGPRAQTTEARLAATLVLSGLSGARDQQPVAASLPTRGSLAFHDSGLFILASPPGDSALFSLADAGELGYLSIAAHGHADALSFTLAVGEDQFVVDPGTASYHYDKKARAYFRSTLAHNTITVDHRDQSIAAGPFLWTRKARTTVHEWSVHADGARLRASHDGYRRLKDPVVHTRTFDLHDGHYVIDDLLTGTVAHDVEWRLHLAPQCTVDLSANRCVISGERHRLALHLDRALHWSSQVGANEGGWYSSGFNLRQPSVTVVGGARLTLPTRLHHELEVLQ